VAYTAERDTTRATGDEGRELRSRSAIAASSMHRCPLENFLRGLVASSPRGSHSPIRSRKTGTRPRSMLCLPLRPPRNSARTRVQTVGLQSILSRQNASLR
jgi:hypothetical protein